MKLIEEFDKNIGEFISFYIGENAKENSELYDKMDKLDKSKIYWAHLEDYPSAHVYFMLPKMAKKCKMKWIKYAGRLVKINSKYKNVKDLRVCYTTKQNLKKTDVLGEVEIIGEYNTIYV